MAYANLTDVENILDPDISLPATGSREERNLLTALQEATDLVEGYLERQYTAADTDEDTVPDDVPGPVRRVVARVAMRGFLDEPDNPGAAAEVSLMGPFSHTINWSKDAQDRSLYLTKGEETRLEPYKAGYSGGAVHLPMAGACGDLWSSAYQ